MENDRRKIPRLLSLLAAPASKRPRAAVFAMVLLAALSAFVIAGSSFESDVSRLIPSNADKTSLYMRLMEDFGSMEKLYVILSADDIGRHLDRIDRIGGELASSGLFKDVRWKITPETRAFVRDSLMRKIPLYLTDEEMSLFLERLSPDGMRFELLKTAKRLVLPGGKRAAADPLSLYETYKSHMRFADVDFDISSGYFITPDGKLLIMLATPEGSPRDISFSSRLIEHVEGVLEAGAGEGIEASITGAHAIALHEASIMKGEIIKNFFVALAGVLVIFLILFRSLAGLFASVTPVMMSILLTLSLSSLFLGSITEVSGGFSGLLIGLGVDLGIVLYVRFALGTASGLTPQESAEKGIRGAGAGITVGVLTTAATFFPMLLSSFRGIRELGLLTGMGILITWAALFAMFPLFSMAGRRTRMSLRMVELVFRSCHKRPVATIAAIALVTAALAAFIPGVRIEEDVIKLGARKNPASETLKGLQKVYTNHNNIIITGTAASPEEASEKSARISRLLEHPFSISDLLPPVSRQQRNIEALGSLDAGAVVERFRDEAREVGLDPSAFDGYLGWLRDAIGNRELVDMGDLGPLGYIMDRTLKGEQGGYRFAVSGSLKDPDDTSAIDAVQGISYTGPPFVRKELLGLLKRDALIITACGLLLVNLILLVDFRRPLFVIVCQIPVLLSAAWVLGLMSLLGISLNFMNAIVFVMLFGIGTDYSIHLLHRRAAGCRIDEMARDTGSAVVLAALTTIAGFGSMSLSAYRGLATLGASTALGVAACAILSITFIPAFFRVLDDAKGRGNRP